MRRFAFGREVPILRGDKGKFAYTSQNINTCILCQILHSFPHFFISLLPTAFFLRSRMTGKQLILFRMKSFYVFAHTCPFRQLRRHHPRVRGWLPICILSFHGNNRVIHFNNYEFFFPWRWLPPNTEGSAESARR